MRKGDKTMGKQTAWDEIDKKAAEIIEGSDEICGNRIYRNRLHEDPL